LEYAQRRRRGARLMIGRGLEAHRNKVHVQSKSGLGKASPNGTLVVRQGVAEFSPSTATLQIKSGEGILIAFATGHGRPRWMDRSLPIAYSPAPSSRRSRRPCREFEGRQNEQLRADKLAEDQNQQSAGGGSRKDPSQNPTAGAFADGRYCLNLAAAQLRHTPGTTWSAKCHINMRPLNQRRQSETEVVA
jgi:hypothetical protein